MKRIFGKKPTICLVFLGIWAMFLSATASADQSDILKPLLVDISGWTTENPEGMSMDMGAVRMVNAYRNYSREDKNMDATIMVGSNAMMEGQSQPMNMETADASINTSEINGFSVIRTFDKKDNSGYVLVNIAKASGKGALFVLNYSAITPAEALETAKKFDWKAMKEAADSILAE